jgi:hypothetical protein
MRVMATAMKCLREEKHRIWEEFNKALREGGGGGQSYSRGVPASDHDFEQDGKAKTSTLIPFSSSFCSNNSSFPSTPTDKMLHLLASRSEQTSPVPSRLASPTDRLLLQLRASRVAAARRGLRLVSSLEDDEIINPSPK